MNLYDLLFYLKTTCIIHKRELFCSKEKMKYIKLKFEINFEKKILFRKNPAIILRSLMGKELKILTCVLRQMESCNFCQLNKTCVYSWFFETNIQKNTSSIAGRNKGSHPFIPFVEYNPKKATDLIYYEITLLGRGTDYIPYIYFALQKVGEKGLYKERIKFTVTDIISGNTSILDKENNRVINNNFIKEWNNSDFVEQAGSVLKKRLYRFDFITPFRFKKDGRYQDEFLYQNILIAASRRLRILFDLYEENGKEFDVFKLPDNLPNKEIIKSNTSWSEFIYYSHRQNTSMKLGGITGSVLLRGAFTSYEQYLLKSAMEFNIGKNIAFSLGKVVITEEEII